MQGGIEGKEGRGMVARVSSYKMRVKGEGFMVELRFVGL